MDYFLARRSLTWPVVGISLYASNMSSSSIIGLSGSGYETGISVFNYELVGIIILIIFAVYFVPVYLQTKVYTMPEFLERRYDHRSRYYFSFLTIVINIGLDIAGALYAGGLLLQLIFPEIDLATTIILLALVTGAYTMAGGLKAVVMTDIFQGIFLSLGCFIVTIMVYQEIGSWSAISAAADPDMFSLIRPLDDPVTPWPTLLISLPLLSFYFWCSNQHIVQRVLGARSIDHGRKGAIMAGFLKLMVIFIMIFPGIMALSIYPDLDNPNLVLPKLMLDFLPAGILGLVLVGFIAALMSSIDSALNSASTLATMDFYKKFRPESDQGETVWTGRIFTLLFVLIAAIWAPYIDQFPTLWEYLQAALSYLIPPVVACFLAGVFWKKATPLAAIISLISGGLVSLLIIALNLMSIFPETHYLYIATLIFVISTFLLILISYFKPEEYYKTEIPKLFLSNARTPFSGGWSWRGYQIFALILMAITIMFFILLR